MQGERRHYSRRIVDWLVTIRTPEGLLEGRIKDIYRGVLQTVIVMRQYKEIPIEFNDEIKTEIINTFNDMNFIKNCGIEMKDLVFRIM